MERLITCSKVLYDKDIQDKMAEIKSLKKSLARYETPEIVYSNWQEKTDMKCEAYKIIKEGINNWIKDNNFLCLRFMAGNRPFIPECICEALNFITNNKHEEWSYHKSYDMFDRVETFINSCIAAGVWNIVYAEIDPVTMVNLIYNNIILQVNYIFENEVFTICNKCEQKKNTCRENNTCFNCRYCYKCVNDVSIRGVICSNCQKD